ncbi:hypothetical protein BKA70DRAFT_1302126 [Coprinopsis sp. MPI-PUGE-AT-0042]|nr:hypothetical protein BKA70DRAFT_1302126 [Coprinopsis sp. MPI-PUGE-AT-0042]
MSDHDDDHQQPQVDRKGKQRATVQEPPSEETPLLGGTSQISWIVANDVEDSGRARRTLWSKLTRVFVASLLVCVVVFVILGLLAWSYAARAAGLTPEGLINNDLTFEGPHRLVLSTITRDGGVWLTVHGRMGVDVGNAMGFNPKPEDGLLESLWKKIGRQGVRSLSTVSVNLSTITITPKLAPSITLAKLHVQPLDVPLDVNPPKDDSWLHPVAVTALVYPTTNATLFKEFIHDSWKSGYLAIRAEVDHVLVRGGTKDRRTWRATFEGKISHIRTSLRIKVPPIPGLPEPGSGSPLPDPSELIVLKSFALNSASSRLNISADAMVLNPAPEAFKFTSPPLPFTVSIFDDEGATVDMASVVRLPLKSSSSSALSTFLNRYLSGNVNPISIASQSFPGLSVTTNFPGPNPRPHVLRNVTIHDMKIKAHAHGGGFLASGIVSARIVLPKGMNIGMDVSRVFPDVLVFDGEVGDEDVEDATLPSDPLPDPIPPRAFGRIRPDKWLIAESRGDDQGEGEGAAYAVQAEVKDVPMEVLPGRQKEFSEFVRKVIFHSDGALAGLLGTAAVEVEVEGLPMEHTKAKSNHLTLTGLPFQGSVRINKHSVLHGQLEALERFAERILPL